MNWKFVAILIVVIVLVSVAAVALAYVGIQNDLVNKDVAVDQAWSDMRIQYQRRFDLIPKLEDMVNKYMKYEGSLLTNITALRSNMATFNMSSNEQQVELSNQLERTITAFTATAENYPDLKASTLFSDFMAELAGTENRVAVVRDRYNEAVRDYNTALRTIPSSWVASMMGLEKRQFFLGSEGIENPPY
jgi:LemA protein